jgi:glycosyltransferase involved in cell wall biosynthesis
MTQSTQNQKRKSNRPLFSIIIPVRHPNAYLKETKNYIKNQTLKSFELIVVTDKISLSHSQDPHHLGPSFKRNLGAKLASGRYLAFLDDDSYPDSCWLENALKLLKAKNIAAVCGPCLIPPADNILQKASGLYYSTPFGSGGAGRYRNHVSPPRFVDDYPSVNLIVKKNDFFNSGGFNTDYWPGEDTLLCLNLTHHLHKRILYHPTVIVFHHRRAVIIPHLQQITRYAKSRGFFAKKFPQTSLRLGYFLPSLFLLYLSFLPLLFSFRPLFIVPLFVYLLLLLLSFLALLIETHSLILSLLSTITIPITHLYYGLIFLLGLLQKDLVFQPHQVNSSTGEYLGG